MPFLAFFIVGLALVIFGVACLLALTAFVIGWRKKNRTLKYLGGVPLGLLVGLGLFVVWKMSAAYTPADAYQQSFGFAPTSDVTNLKSSGDFFGDSGITYLYFKAAPSTVKRIAALGLKRVPFKAGNNGSAAPAPSPSWWKPRVNKNTQIYRASRRVGDFLNEEDEVFYYDPATRDAYYSYFGFD